jgi:uncharacterized protein (TIGR03435 family)
MTRKTTIALVIAAGALTISALVVIVKPYLFPSAKDAWFTVDSDGLRWVPANLIILRSTRLSLAGPKIRHAHDGDSLTRTVGRDVSFRDLMAEAYDCEPGNVILPPGTPQGQFDFLVTVPHPREPLRDAISRQLGYTAHHETTDTEVFKLQVTDASLPGFTISPDSEDSDITRTNGRLYFIHKPLSVIVDGLQDGLGKPVLDETGLTNRYDFSVAWNLHAMRAMQGGTFQIDGVQQALSHWGLQLMSGIQSMDMVVVENKP